MKCEAFSRMQALVRAAREKAKTRITSTQFAQALARAAREKAKTRITYTQFGQCARLEDVPDGATIETLNGQPVIALCASCGSPIVDDDTAFQWFDGVWTCGECEGPPGAP